MYSTLYCRCYRVPVSGKTGTPIPVPDHNRLTSLTITQPFCYIKDSLCDKVSLLLSYPRGLYVWLSTPGSRTGVTWDSDPC